MSHLIVFLTLFLTFLAVKACGEESVKRPSSIAILADLDRSVAALIESGASEISHQIGIKTAYKSRWLLLPGKTCVLLASRDGSTISLIEVGEKGKGYGGKASWQAQEKTTLSEIVVRRGEFQFIQEK
ncbi:hypothetical protein [Prosthecobacter sp.]|uniref:hypothetical protein n=1 Tax=Prosthecobacter sp. TaxID=1965333 RepID=UPI0037844CB9